MVVFNTLQLVLIFPKTDKKEGTFAFGRIDIIYDT